MYTIKLVIRSSREDVSVIGDTDVIGTFKILSNIYDEKFWEVN